MFSLSFIVIAVIIIVALLILFSFVPIGLWISALAAGVHVGIGTLVVCVYVVYLQEKL
ncbi:hypothetical protein ACVPOS_13260 [Staphylococcus aureus]